MSFYNNQKPQNIHVFLSSFITPEKKFYFDLHGEIEKVYKNILSHHA